MKLSIVMPVYNAAVFLEQAIHSVLDQGWKDLELILVDDGSVDNSLEICRRYESDMVRCIHTENHGTGHARNTGMKAARGEWVTFLDNDDLYLDGFLSPDLGNFLDWCTDQGVDLIYTPRLKTDILLEEEPEVLYPEKLDEIPHHVPRLEFWTCIYSAKLLQEKKIRFYEYQLLDVESAFRFQAFSQAKKVLCTPDLPFILIRDNKNSAGNTWNWHHYYQVKTKVYLDLFLNHSSRSDDDALFLYEQFVSLICEYLNFMKEKGCPSQEAKEAFGLLKLYRKTKSSAKNLSLNQHTISCVEVLDQAARREQAKKIKKDILALPVQSQERAKAKPLPPINTEIILKKWKELSLNYPRNYEKVKLALKA